MHAWETGVPETSLYLLLNCSVTPKLLQKVKSNRTIGKATAAPSLERPRLLMPPGSTAFPGGGGRGQRGVERRSPNFEFRTTHVLPGKSSSFLNTQDSRTCSGK